MVSAIQAIPYTATIAIIPERKTSFLEIDAGLVLVRMIISAPVSSMNIWITRTIDSGLPPKEGRSSDTAPRTATTAIAARKIHIASQLLLGSFLSNSVAVSP
ncbi:hypothetical protein D3C73_1355370 [compost metagenome]